VRPRVLKTNLSRETFPGALMMTLKNTLLALLPLAALAAVPACSSDPEPKDPGAVTGDDDELVDVSNTDKVSNQSIGNCWVYATSAWAEALHRGYTGEQTDISESYVSYIDWFHGIQDGDFDDKEGLQTGGWFFEAAGYLADYGVMEEGTFIPEEATAEKSSRQASALAAINASLKSGVLSDAAKRRDPNVVRDELDKAFKLNPDVISLLDATFGHDLSRSGSKATFPAGKGFRASTDFGVGKYKPTGQVLSLADATGTAPYAGARTRSGQFAWNETSYPYSNSPTAVRSFFKSMQVALHKSRPVVMTWFVDFNAMNRTTGVFANIPATPGRQGGHMTVLEDYQVSNVPGFGTLAAGTLVTDQAALDAALDPSATIDFVRIKNSWGSAYEAAAGTTDLKGYHDLYYPYLTGMIPRCDKKDADGKCLPQSPSRGLTGFVLPSAAWDQVTTPGENEPAPTPDPDPTPEPGNTCSHELCSAGKALTPDCDPCVAKICDEDPFCCKTQWDSQCKDEVKSVCEQDLCSK
jgi:hypothetical protein